MPRRAKTCFYSRPMLLYDIVSMFLPNSSYLDSTLISTLTKEFVSRPFGCLVVAFLLTSVNCSIVAADESSAREHLSMSPATQYLQRDGFRIERADDKWTKPAGSMVFQKFLNDIPVHGNRVIVFEDSTGAVKNVLDDSLENLKLDSAEPAFSMAKAEELLKETIVNSLGSESKLVWFRQDGELLLAWEVTTAVADAGLPASPTGMETVVSAATGQILSQRQLDTKTYQLGSPEVADGVFPRIVINNTIGAAGSRAYAASFDAVVEVDFGCTGVLVAENLVLCARHCGISAGDTVRFGENSNNPVLSRTVQSAQLPDGGGSLLDGGDVVILTLTQTVPANVAVPMRLIDETNGLVGMVCATVGYGFNGLGSQGHNFSSDGFRWGGENVIDVYGSPASSGGSNVISTDFDNGTGGSNSINGSSVTPLEFEATTAGGDSGGPVMVQIGSEWLVAGVLSGGSSNTSVFGDISWWTGTAIYRSQIEAAGGVFAGDTSVTIVGGPPAAVSSAGGDVLSLIFESEAEEVVSGGGTLHVNSGSGFETFPLSGNPAGTSFTVEFPATECMTNIEYYVSFELASGVTFQMPPEGPSDPFNAFSSDGLTSKFSDSFQTNTGWTVSGNAADGQWQRAIPNNGDRGDPSDDAEDGAAGLCFVTDNGNGGDDNTDVDDGETILTSPVMDAAEGPNEVAFISYYRWYSNDFGASPNADTFVVDISNDGGATWVNLETVGPTGAETAGGWVFVNLPIGDFVTPTSNMRVRFNASDLGEGSVIEAGVDGVNVELIRCGTDVLLGDINMDGVVNLLDIQGLVDLLATGGFQAEADFNEDGVVNFLDIQPFIDVLSSS